MRYGSVCSGIEAATVAWHPMGWEPQWFSEIEPFPCRVLDYYYPWVPNLGDMLKIEQKTVFNERTIDLLVGGTPCQAFSLAGLRGGLDDKRSNLALEFCRILLRKRPRWFVWENVPGVLSSFSGGTRSEDAESIIQTSDFGTLLNAFQECGYSCAYRIFDSKYFGVPQRRRRVFVVGYLGTDWRPPVAVLFERESLRRDFAPRKSAWKSKPAAQTCTGSDVSGTIPSSGGGLTRSAGNENEIDFVVLEEKEWPAEVAPTLDRCYAKNWGQDNQHIEAGGGLFVPMNIFTYKNKRHGMEESEVANTLKKKSDTGERSSGAIIVVDARQDPITSENISLTLGKMDRGHAICVDTTQITSPTNRSNPKDEISPTLTKGGDSPLLITHIARRPTPLECERLQGFPDGYTDIPGASDNARYAALGNSMTIQVMEWIGKRIDKVDKLLMKLR